MPEETPVLPATPWYESAVQRAAVAGMVTSVLAIVAQLFELNVDAQIINVKAGLVLQLANLGFSLAAIVRRKNSAIQPLTLTKTGAEVKNAANPSVVSPTPGAP